MIPDAFILENGGTDAETQAIFVLEQFLRIVDRLPGEVSSLISLGLRPRPPAPADSVTASVAPAVEPPPPCDTP